jgi:hypothetical protein
VRLIHEYDTTVKKLAGENALAYFAAESVRKKNVAPLYRYVLLAILDNNEITCWEQTL